VLHLGLGRFFRAHQACYFERLNQLPHGPGWTISAWSMRSPQAAESVGTKPYPVYVPAREPSLVDPRRGTLLRVGALQETGFIGTQQALLRERWLDPELALVTLTVTEKGYAEPLFELLRAGLEQRMSRRLAPVTLISCDNLMDNGDRLRRGLLESAPGPLGDWLAERCAFPNSVVDRIVPALDPSSLAAFASQAGIDPIEAPRLVVTEPFSLWVLEDRFASERPELERVGVQMVQRALPYGRMKLGVLNLAHSWLAYTGLAREGTPATFVHEASADPGFTDVRRARSGLARRGPGLNPSSGERGSLQ